MPRSSSPRWTAPVSYPRSRASRSIGTPIFFCRSKCRKTRRLSFSLAGYTSTPVRIPCLQSTVASIKCLVGQRVIHSTFGTGTVLDVDMEKGVHLVKFDEMETPRKISFKAKWEQIGAEKGRDQAGRAGSDGRSETQPGRQRERMDTRGQEPARLLPSPCIHVETFQIWPE